MKNPDDIQKLCAIINKLHESGQYDKLLSIITVPVLQQLNMEAAKARLSRLQITKDHRFILVDYGNKDVELSPVNKALYLLFLNHPEGIEFKQMVDHREELREIYSKICNRVTEQTIEDTIDRLINPLDNSINEKCARIKSAFAQMMDQYQLCYYAISSHTVRHIEGTSHAWFERKKVITLPREKVFYE